MSVELQLALASFFRGLSWLRTVRYCSSLRSAVVDYFMIGTLPHLLRPVAGDLLLHHMNILVPYFRQREQLSQDTGELLNEQDLHTEIENCWYSISVIFSLLAGLKKRERAGLLRCHQVQLIEAYIHSRSRDTEEVIANGGEIWELVPRGASDSWFTIPILYLLELRSERTELLIVRYLEEPKDDSCNLVVKGVTAATKQFYDKRARTVKQYEALLSQIRSTGRVSSHDLDNFREDEAQLQRRAEKDSSMYSDELARGLREFGEESENQSK
ncbi:hypothetical protein BJ508DRAFT_93329 [Ascobolus immersus RN42]|uniref:Uncharacterized protein n=1 Tax=Ascobolus immersus RN42 TaxID=1160509 RepID=A0A3N4IKS1_ASCIM|nr:hypothetical protein BJ508DRAFT_93329 [Ascobolus immersus RN42]